ncbi:hypothetical protein [Azonexus sp.]|uniref:hypothetical protein n=1 Tax=Azonexus sp. TaxID=1872668 RepID=UPI0027BA08B6|nr:hypothetical protein [Azonexus sp.]
MSRAAGASGSCTHSGGVASTGWAGRKDQHAPLRHFDTALTHPPADLIGVNALAIAMPATEAPGSQHASITTRLSSSG